MDKLGIRMDSIQDRFIELFLQQAHRFGKDFSSFEIGTAEGFTFGGLCKVFVDNLLEGSMVSCDIPNGWSLAPEKLKRNMDSSGVTWSVSTSIHIPDHNAASIYMISGRDLIGVLNRDYGFKPSFVFVDGCHGHCVKGDFLSIEPTVPVGGIVAFHDSGTFENKGDCDWQGHCGTFIRVRPELETLGLLDGTRNGWELIDDVQGDREYGGEGHGCVFVQRVDR